MSEHAIWLKQNYYAKSMSPITKEKIAFKKRISCCWPECESKAQRVPKIAKWSRGP